MIALIGLVIVVLFVILLKSGLLEDLAKSGGRPPGAPEEGSPGLPGAERHRLDVFEEFMEGLDDEPPKAPPA